MSDSFNPYVQWLGIDPSIVEPTYYELFELSPTESDEHVITQAADRAISKVRGCRPGAHAAQWAELLDTLRSIKTCLLDRERRAAYDQYLQQNETAAAPQPTHSVEESTSVLTGPNYMYPPGMGGNVVQTTPSPSHQPTSQAFVAATPQAEVPVLEEATPEPTSGDPAYAMPVRYSAPVQPQVNPVGSSPAYASPMALPVSSVGIQQAPIVAMPVMPTTPPQSAVLDPMAPVSLDGDAHMSQQATSPYSYAGPMSTQANPMAPAMPDPMAPVASAVPYGYASPVASPTAGPFQSPYESAQRMVAPADSEVEIPGPELKGKSTPTKMANERQQQSKQTPIVLATGLALFALFAVGVVFALKNTQSTEVVDNTDSNTTPSTVPNEKPDNDRQVLNNLPVETPALRPPKTPTVEGPKPNSDSDPETTTVPPVTPMPKPNPMIPMPNPMPVPVTPTPMPAPMPMPVPVVQPTRDEVVALSKSLTTARIALYEKNIEVAEEELKKAEPLAKLPEHKAKLERLQEITRHVHQFWDAVVQGTGKLDGGVVLDYKGVPVAIVEATPTKVIYRINGRNNTREIRDLGEGLAILIANQVLVQEDPATKVIKGAIFAVKFDKDNPQYKAEALQLWQEAALAGADVDHLIQFLDDDYDLLKDLDAS